MASLQHITKWSNDPCSMTPTFCRLFVNRFITITCLWLDVTHRLSQWVTWQLPTYNQYSGLAIFSTWSTNWMISDTVSYMQPGRDYSFSALTDNLTVSGANSQYWHKCTSHLTGCFCSRSAFIVYSNTCNWLSILQVIIDWFWYESYPRNKQWLWHLFRAQDHATKWTHKQLQ